MLIKISRSRRICKCTLWGLVTHKQGGGVDKGRKKLRQFLCFQLGDWVDEGAINLYRGNLGGRGQVWGMSDMLNLKVLVDSGT